MNQHSSNPRVQSVLDLLESEGITYTFVEFPSGAAMIDLEFAGRYFCIQVTDTYFGYSEITEEDPGFSTLPTHGFRKFRPFASALRKVFKELEARP